MGGGTYWPNHNIGLGVTETGVAINDQNGVAVWYASTLGEFMKNNVEVFTPWSWQPAMWEVVNLFTEYSQDYYHDAISTNEELISAYTTADEKNELIASIFVNKSTNSSQNVTLNLNGIYIDQESVKAYRLSNLGNSETFFSDEENALIESSVEAQYKSISFNLPPLSILAITFKSMESIPTGINLINEDIKLNIYPNPYRGGLLRIEHSGDKLNYLRLISLDGSITKTIYKPSNEIVIEDMPKGFYIMQLRSTKGLFEKKLFIH